MPKFEKIVETIYVVSVVLLPFFFIYLMFKLDGN